MKTYKKGISLIVLVITVLVLAILATTVIVSLSNTNIINEANDAVSEYNLKQYEAQMNLAYAAWLADNQSSILTNVSELEDYGFKVSDLPEGKSAIVSNGKPKIITANVWDGTIATSFDGGTGTSSDPYLISTGAQLAAINFVPNQAYYYKLTNNIDLAGIPWTPIPINDVNGEVNGDNYTIYNLNVSNVEYAGLFERGMNNGVSISNLNLNGGVVSGKYAGAFAGYGMDAWFENCVNYGVTVIGEVMAGGITTYCQLSAINCVNYADVYCYTGEAFGIGESLSQASGCINYGTINGKMAAGISILNGEPWHSFNNIINYGDIIGTEAAYGLTNYESYEDSSCLNYGTVTITGK